jgi:glc operon protein GlcG
VHHSVHAHQQAPLLVTALRSSEAKLEKSRQDYQSASKSHALRLLMACIAGPVRGAKMENRRKLLLALRVSVATGLILGVLTLPTQKAAAQFTEKKVLTLAAAQKMVVAAQAEAERQRLAGVIAVADDGGWPILVVRMDNAAYVASVELAPGKARTAALFKKPSQALEDAINHGRIAAVTAHGYIEMQGGLPIVVDGQVIGGIGASFDTPEHDVQIAQAGLAALNR